MDRVQKMVVITQMHYSPKKWSGKGKIMQKRFVATNKRVNILKTAKEDKDLVRMCLDLGLAAAKACNKIIYTRLGQLCCLS